MSHKETLQKAETAVRVGVGEENEESVSTTFRRNSGGGSIEGLLW